MQSEHDIQNLIRIALSANDCTVFRANVGKVKMQNDRWFDTGLPKGHFDLYGFRHSDGKVFYIEVKNEVGRPRSDQIKFHEMLTHWKIIHGIARSPEQAVDIVKKGLVGYGFK